MIYSTPWSGEQHVVFIEQASRMTSLWWADLDSHCMSSGRKLQSAAAAWSTQSTQIRLCVLQRPVLTTQLSLLVNFLWKWW